MKLNVVKLLAGFFVLICAGMAQGGWNDWRGKRVAFLGDSITDAQHVGCTSNYWNYLERDLGLVPLVYGISGHRWKQIYDQGVKLFSEHPQGVDAIMIFAGTNDYNANDPLGEWVADETTFRGRITRAMDYLRANYPTVPVWLLTPIHRGYATFGASNVQPDESYANTLGLWVDSYVGVLKEAAAKWRVNLIDLNAESGLYPLASSHTRFFHNAATDMLHPNDVGHARMAAAIASRLVVHDATPHLRRMLDATPDGGTLRLAKDVYHLYWHDAVPMALAPSNNKSGEKQVLFPIVGRHGLTLDGGGSTFVVHGKVFPFAVTNSTGITLKNFTMMSHYPAVAACTVTEKTAEGFTVRFAEDVCPYRTENGCIVFRTEGEETGTSDRRLSLHGTQNGIHFLFAGETTASFEQVPATFVRVDAEDRGGRTVFFRYRACSVSGSTTCPYAVGETGCVNLAENRDRLSVFFEDCADVAVENVALPRGAGMGVVAQRTRNVTLRGFTSCPLAGERITLTADTVQLINCCGQVLMDGCRMGWALDDPVNIHGNYLQVESVNGRTVRLRTKHGSHAGFFPYRVGDALEFVDAHRRDVKASAHVASWTPDANDDTACTVTVDADVSAVAAGQLVENATLNPDVTIRNCTFTDFYHLRLSGRGTYLVENNRFERGSAAVMGMDLADYWYESGRIQNMTIRNNVVVGRGGFTFGLSGWNGNESDLPLIHDTVILEGNVFENFSGAKWSAVGVRNFQSN